MLNGLNAEIAIWQTTPHKIEDDRVLGEQGLIPIEPLTERRMIATGMIVGELQKPAGSPVFDLNGYDVVKAGVALFILLPIARVALMLTIFLRERDYVYVMISALVLLIIAAGIFVEL